MKSIGFSHFVSTAPNHLALVAPDGRHWSRAELLEESLRQARHSSGKMPAIPATSAEYLALLLAAQDPAGGGKTISGRGEQQTFSNSTRHPALPPGIYAPRDETLYIGTSLAASGASAWALSALHRGCPLIITNQWQLAPFFRSVQQYQVTGCFLSARQMTQITSSSQALLRQYDLSSIRDVFVDGKPIPTASNWPGKGGRGKNSL